MSGIGLTLTGGLSPDDPATNADVAGATAGGGRQTSRARRGHGDDDGGGERELPTLSIQSTASSWPSNGGRFFASPRADGATGAGRGGARRAAGTGGRNGSSAFTCRLVKAARRARVHVGARGGGGGGWRGGWWAGRGGRGRAGRVCVCVCGGGARARSARPRPRARPPGGVGVKPRVIGRRRACGWAAPSASRAEPARASPPRSLTAGPRRRGCSRSRRGSSRRRP